MPEVKPNETQKNYVRRCIPYLMDNEGLEEKHAIAKCYGMYRQHSKKARKRANAG